MRRRKRLDSSTTTQEKKDRSSKGRVKGATVEAAGRKRESIRLKRIRGPFERRIHRNEEKTPTSAQLMCDNDRVSKTRIVQGAQKKKGSRRGKEAVLWKSPEDAERIRLTIGRDQSRLKKKKTISDKETEKEGTIWESIPTKAPFPCSSPSKPDCKTAPS